MTNIMNIGPKDLQGVPTPEEETEETLAKLAEAAPPVEVAAPQAPAPLTHVAHAEVFLDHLRRNAEGFQAALAALETEFNGNENAYVEATLRRQEEFNRSQGVADTNHGDAQFALQRRIDDLRLALARAEAGMAANLPDLTKERN